MNDRAAIWQFWAGIALIAGAALASYFTHGLAGSGRPPEGPKWTDIIQAASALATLAFTGGLLFVTVKQWGVASDSAQAALRSANIARVALLSDARPDLEMTATAPVVSLRDGIFYNIAGKFSLSNVGSAPSRLEHVTASIVVPHVGLSASDFARLLGPLRDLPPELQASGYLLTTNSHLLPDKPFTANYGAVIPVASQQGHELAGMIRRMWLVVRAVYVDRLGVRREQAWGYVQANGVSWHKPAGPGASYEIVWSYGPLDEHS